MRVMYGAVFACLILATALITVLRSSPPTPEPAEGTPVAAARRAPAPAAPLAESRSWEPPPVEAGPPEPQQVPAATGSGEFEAAPEDPSPPGDDPPWFGAYPNATLRDELAGRPVRDLERLLARCRVADLERDAQMPGTISGEITWDQFNAIGRERIGEAWTTYRAAIRQIVQQEVVE